MGIEVSDQPGRIAHRALALVLVATILVYANSLGGDFVWDDIPIVVENPQNRHGIDLFATLTQADTAFADERTPYYRPLNRLIYLIEYRIFRGNATGFHAVSVVLHAANAGLVLIIGWHVFGRMAPALLAALLFGLHPINAEAVNFISGRNNLLATFFALSAFLAFRRADQRHRPLWTIAAAMLFLLGLLAKETALMLLGVLQFYDLALGVPLRRALVSRFVALLPLSLIACLYWVIRTGVLAGETWAPPVRVDLFARLTDNIYIIPKYLGLVFYPSGLSIYHVVPPGWRSGQIWIYPVLVTLAGAAAWAVYRGGQASRLGLLWMAMNYVPISNLVPIPSAPIAERYLYLPLIGLWWVAADLWGHMESRTLFQLASRTVAALLLLILSWVTVQRNKVWHDEISLFSDVATNQPDVAFGHYNLGNAYLASRDMDRAKYAWEAAVIAHPTHSLALNQLGNLHLLGNRLGQAESFYQRAVEANPANAEAQYNLAQLYERTGQPERALEHYQLFIERAPRNYEAMMPAIREKIRRQ
jgi:tetratricopeptide (TPR) repeat protein